ncbi:MAG: PaaI family thioesterase [Acidimicrobiales bacterium]
MSVPGGSDLDHLEPRRRLAEALRPIIAMVVASELDDHAMEEAAESIERAGGRLAERAGGKRLRPQPDVTRPPQEFFPTSPVMGLVNPVAPPVLLDVVDSGDGRPREIRGRVTFGDAYEGPPTCVHGGVIAETFDEVLGAVNMVAGSPGMTGTLTVRYRRPTPLNTDLTIVARFVGRSGRKIRTWAGMYRGEQLTAEAEGIFVEVPPEQFLSIAEGNVDSADPGMVEAVRAEALRVGPADLPSPPPGSPRSR